MKQNKAAKTFIWVIIILMILALMIGPLASLITSFFQDDKPTLQDLIKEGKVTITTAAPSPEVSESTQANTEVDTEENLEVQAIIETSGPESLPIAQ